MPKNAKPEPQTEQNADPEPHVEEDSQARDGIGVVSYDIYGYHTPEKQGNSVLLEGNTDLESDNPSPPVIPKELENVGLPDVEDLNPQGPRGPGPISLPQGQLEPKYRQR